ncbi:MAG TPA: hypothetical protein VF698_10650 [Thermoanaerobaculia bacterium]|jgi:tetratricopeptide (TPR) repeat protein
MRKSFFVILLLIATAAGAQQNQRFMAPRPDPATITVHRDVPFRDDLKFDLYRPKNDDVVPVVVFVNIGHSGFRHWPGYVGWGEAVAGAGMAGVLYEALQSSPAADLDAVIATLQKRAAEYRIDPSRIVIWSSSSNVTLGLPVAMDAKREYVRGAVVYYGDAPVQSIRLDVPVLVGRAGRDNPELNKRIDALLGRALSENAPWSIENHGFGVHGFDAFDDDDVTRYVIARTLDFMKRVTTPGVSKAYLAGVTEAANASAFARGDWPKAIAGYRARLAANPNDAEGHRRLGLALLNDKQYAAALPELETAFRLGRGGTRDTVIPAAAAAASAGNLDRALYWLDRALVTPFANVDEIRNDERFANVRDHVRFIKLVADIETQRKITALLDAGKLDEGMAAMRADRSGRFGTESVLIPMAYGLLARGRDAEAIAVFAHATTLFPKSANAWDSLSEAYEKVGKTREALEAARRAASLVASDTSLDEVGRENVRREAEARIARLTSRP